MKIPVDLVISVIKKSEECRNYLELNYPYEFEIWTRFSTKNGDHCAFARAALNRISKEEFNKYGKAFVFSLGSEEWGSRGYQESISRKDS